MPFVTQGKTNFGYLSIVLALAIIAGALILGYYHFWIIELEARIVELEAQLLPKGPPKTVNDFVDCVAAGYSVSAFYPKQCIVPEIGTFVEEYCVQKDTDSIMTLADAEIISAFSECGSQLKDTHMCNENTGTWWIDLDIEKEGCNPACVINIETGEAEINWRCTGLIPE